MHDSPVWGAIVVAAGRSLRFGDTDKTLIKLDGRAILAHSIASLLVDDRLHTIVVVASAANLDACEGLVASSFPGVEITSCVGGATRSESVRAGLMQLPATVNFVAVHDAARPLAPGPVVRQVLDATEKSGAAVPVVPIAGTLLVEGSSRRVEGGLTRERVREAQTPQAASRLLLEAALRAYPDETDESTALFRYGAAVTTVPGHRQNIKITTPEDFRLAQALLLISGSES